MIGFAPKCSGTVGKCEHNGHRKLRLGNSGVLGNIKIEIKTRDVAKYRLSNVNLNFIYTHRFLHQFSQYVFTWNDSWAHLNILNPISFYLVSERSRCFLYLAYIFPLVNIEVKKYQVLKALVLVESVSYSNPILLKPSKHDPNTSPMLDNFITKFVPMSSLLCLNNISQLLDPQSGNLSGNVVSNHFLSGKGRQSSLMTLWFLCPLGF